MARSPRSSRSAGRWRTGHRPTRVQSRGGPAHRNRGDAVTGRIVQVSVSAGGVPKTAVARAEVTVHGLEGDGHRDHEHHGGPERAVCIFAVEAIEALRVEGHPIVPGGLGENLTIARP